VEEQHKRVPEQRTIRWNDAEIQITEVVHRGWEGILYRIQETENYLLAFLEWRNGGYLEQFRPITGDDLKTWLSSSDTEETSD
jgi:hypothetical protein